MRDRQQLSIRGQAEGHSLGDKLWCSTRDRNSHHSRILHVALVDIQEPLLIGCASRISVDCSMRQLLKIAPIAIHPEDILHWTFSASSGGDKRVGTASARVGKEITLRQMGRGAPSRGKVDTLQRAVCARCV